MHELYPVFLKLAGRRVLLVGGGQVAASKLDSLLQAGAQVTVVAPDVRPEIDRPGVVVERRGFREADLEDVWFVVAAATPEVNRDVAAAAERRHLFVNAVDDPANASAYLGGVVRRSGITVAVSTDGRAPALAGLLREGLNLALPETAELDRWVRQAGEIRKRWREEQVPMTRRRPELLAALNELYGTRREAEQPATGDRSAAERSGELEPPRAEPLCGGSRGPALQ